MYDNSTVSANILRNGSAFLTKNLAQEREGIMQYFLPLVLKLQLNAIVLATGA